MMNEMISPYVYPGLTTSMRFCITPELIIERICKFRGLKEEGVRSPKRTRELSFTRHIIYYFVRRLTSLSLTEAGKLFDQDHATVLNGIKRVNNMLETDKKIVQMVAKINLILGANNNYINLDYLSNMEHGKVSIFAFDPGMIMTFHYKHSHTIGNKIFGAVKYYEEPWSNIGNHLYMSLDNYVCIKDQGYRVFMQTIQE